MREENSVRAMTSATATAAFGELSALGPFFAVHTHRPGEVPDATWRTVTELTTPSGALRSRIRVVRAALAERAGRHAEDVELRVAASVAHLGLAARLVAPAIAVMAADRRLDLRPPEMWWQDAIGGPVPLSVPTSAISARDSGTAPGQLIREVIAPLTAAVAGLVPVSQRVLWGNVASAVNGAAAQIASHRPEAGRPAWLAAAAVFGHERLSRERTPPGPGFRRSSCCLLYRLKPGTDALCGDCVLIGTGRADAPV